MQIRDWFRIGSLAVNAQKKAIRTYRAILLPGIKERFRSNTLNSLTIETEVDESDPTGSVHRRFS